ncbi:MAG: TMEM165/GDT1 family protein [Promethearchaeota archaeon]|nr:MAG: TMEM165/GDT1 family protein [Candidatus Lokiarchaeota archaeon]
MDILTILITYGILFAGELGDKTQLIVFNLALEYPKFYKVGIGASLGFAAIVTFGVFFGSLITAFVPVFIITIISGIVFITIGLLESRNLKSLYRENKQTKNSSQNPKNDSIQGNSIEITEKGKFAKLKKNPYLAGFFAIFIMELGDKTQLLTISLTSLYAAPIEVWIGSFLALITVAWIGILLGGFIARKVPKFYLKLISVVLFIFVGVLILFSS